MVNADRMGRTEARHRIAVVVTGSWSGQPGWNTACEVAIELRREKHAAYAVCCSLASQYNVWEGEDGCFRAWRCAAGT